jgi:glycosyltransferase involved in cell wall biosynthesis
MIGDQKVVVVMPAYNAEKTLEQTHAEIVAQEIVDEIIIVDDASHDRTSEVAARLDKVTVHVHPRNLGYGGNQKTCYKLALGAGADMVIMVHPDYQYTPKLVPVMAHLIATGLYPCVLASRILGGQALKGGMPWWRYVSNRALTFWGNLWMGSKLSEFHTGFRAYSGELLRKLHLEENSDDFVFDNQILAQVLWQGASIGEVSCPTSYFAEASSINFRRSVLYGIGCVLTAVEYRLCRWGLWLSGRFRPLD